MNSNNYQTSQYKLKYFCQVCNRQCNDKDGYTCHLKSNTHLIKMEIISENPDEFINNYSLEFEKEFVDILNRMYSGIFVSTNKVYQEYICNRNSIHLNATKWSTLTLFVKSLEQKGKAEIKQTEKETMIKYINAKPEEIMIRKKREREELIERRRWQNIKNMSKEKEKIKILKNISISENSTENIHAISPNDLKVSFEIKNVAKDRSINIIPFHENFSIEKNKNKQTEANITAINKISNNFDLLHTPWLHENLIIKIKDPNLEFFNQKGIIINVEDQYVARVKLLNRNSNVILKVDQAFLEPVIPNIGGKVKILPLENILGIVKSINITESTAEVDLNDKINCKKIINLKHICKYV